MRRTPAHSVTAVALVASMLVALVVIVVPIGVAAAAPGMAQRYDCDAGDGTFAIASRRIDRHEPAGTVGVYADIKNLTGSWREHVRGQICLYDESGRVVDNELIFSEALVVGPHRRTPFYISIDPRADWDHYTLRLISQESKLRTVGKHVEVKTSGARIDDLGRLEVPVTVTNKNSFPIKHVAVYVTLFAANDKIVSIDLTQCNYTDPSKLGPGQVGDYLADAFHDFTHVKRARIQVEAFGSR